MLEIVVTFLQKFLYFRVAPISKNWNRPGSWEMEVRST